MDNHIIDKQKQQFEKIGLLFFVSYKASLKKAVPTRMKVAPSETAMG